MGNDFCQLNKNGSVFYHSTRVTWKWNGFIVFFFLIITVKEKNQASLKL